MAPSALALDCSNTPLEERLAAVDAAFVGRVTEERPGAVAPWTIYRFVVDQRVKGPIGREVDVRADRRLVDAADEPLVHELRRNGGGLGLAAICSGGGQGDAVLVEV